MEHALVKIPHLGGHLGPGGGLGRHGQVWGGGIKGLEGVGGFGGGPAGIESIAATMNEEPDTIVDVVEPFLLKIGFLKRTPRGRELTKLACNHMGFQEKSKETQREMF